MTTNRIDLRKSWNSSPDNPQGLHALLTQLVGEPFRFARVSYGDELTLHFGELKPAHSPKLKNKPYGAYILGVRGSHWVLKSHESLLIAATGIDLEDFSRGPATPIDKEALETNPPIHAESRVLSATPFAVKPVNGFGLQLHFSDGSSLLILPTLPEEELDEEPVPLTAVADWELVSPGGLLSAGPGMNWCFQPTSGAESRA